MVHDRVHDMVHDRVHDRFYSIMTDEVTFHNSEEMSICFRFVDSVNDIREELMQFSKTSTHNRKIHRSRNSEISRRPRHPS